MHQSTSPIYPIEIEEKLLRRKPRFLHKQKLNLVFSEMRSNVQTLKENTENLEQYEELIATNSLLINFPIKQPLPLTWSLYNTFVNLLNYHS